MKSFILPLFLAFCAYNVDTSSCMTLKVNNHNNLYQENFHHEIMNLKDNDKCQMCKLLVNIIERDIVMKHVKK